MTMTAMGDKGGTNGNIWMENGIEQWGEVGTLFDIKNLLAFFVSHKIIILRLYMSQASNF